MKRTSAAIILATITIISINSQTFAYSYKGRFTSGPKEIEVEPGVPGLEAKISFGEVLSTYNYPSWCPPPPPGFMVRVDWQSPNDPNCWINVFWATMQHYGTHLQINYTRNGYLHYVDAWPRDMTCYFPLHCGYNNFELRVDHLVSGKYRVYIVGMDWPLWPTACREDKPYNSWSHAQLFLFDYKELKIIKETNDFIIFSQFYYHGEQFNDTTFDGGNLHVFSDYHLITKIMTTKPEELMPRTITGHLTPEGVLNPTEITFSRWPEGDPEIPCDPLFKFRIYAYRSNQTVRPYGLWHYSEEEWANIAKELKFNLYGQENDVDNDLEATVHEMSLVHLDCLNDTTVCFIPVKGEEMPFDFRYSDALNISSGASMTFNVKDNPDNLVYSIP